MRISERKLFHKTLLFCQNLLNFMPGCSAHSRAFPTNKQLSDQSATLESPDFSWWLLKLSDLNGTIQQYLQSIFTFVTAKDRLLAETWFKHLLARTKLRWALVKRLYEAYFSSGRAAGCGSQQIGSSVSDELKETMRRQIYLRLFLALIGCVQKENHGFDIL